MPFTPVQTLIGGYLLHLSTSSLLSETGRVFGISGIVDNALFGDRATWRWTTILGLVSGPVVATFFGDLGVDDGLAMWQGLGFGRVGLAGLLVGVGTKDAQGANVKLSGRTLMYSGHFLCGVSRLSPRSIIATATFFSTAMITANLFPAPTPKIKYPTATFELPRLSQGTTFTLFVLLGSVIAAQKAARSLLLSYNPATPENSTPDPALDHMRAGPGRLERELPYLLHGLTFSVGLIVSGMVSPLKVLSFLQPFSPSFDPSLAMIVLAGVVPNGIHYARKMYDKKAIYTWEAWRVPTRTDIDFKLIIGSMLFGMGWGLAGVCPGPAVVGLTQGLLMGRGVEKIGIWVGAMAGGMALAGGI